MPQADKINEPETVTPEKLLFAKGLPAEAISKTKGAIKLWLKKIWNFILEAKDLKPANPVGYRIKQIFHASRPVKQHKTDISLTQPQQQAPRQDEAYFFELIKTQPKNLSNYNLLGKYYLENQNFADGKDIYLYLSNHEPTNPEYLGRLAYSCYKLGQYEQAADYYSKSLALDSIQPNRYYNLGICMQHLDKNQEAIEPFYKALELDPQNPKFINTLAKAYEKMSENDKAEKLFLKLRQIQTSEE